MRAVLACRARAGLCMSQDGKNWARLEAEHHTAAVLDAGETGEWDEAFIGSPQVCLLCACWTVLYLALQMSLSLTVHSVCTYHHTLSLRQV